MSRHPKVIKATPWTPEEEEFVRQHYGKMPTKDIAKALGRKVPMVYSKVNYMGLYIKGPQKKSVLSHLRDLYQSYKPKEEII